MKLTHLKSSSTLIYKNTSVSFYTLRNGIKAMLINSKLKGEIKCLSLNEMKNVSIQNLGVTPHKFREQIKTSTAYSSSLCQDTILI